MNHSIYYIRYIILAVIGCLLAALNSNVHVDDALIYYRYIENFIQGNGLVYNIGERFNALTSPLYIYISILLSSITREVELSQVCLNAALMISSSIVILQIFRKQDLTRTGFIAALIFISSKYFYSVFGLETNLFILVSLLCIYFYLQLNMSALSVFCGLLLLTRGEGLFLVIILFLLLYKYHRELLKIKYLAIIAIFVLLNSMFNYYYYGEFLPHTLSVKIGQGSSGLWGRYSYLLGADYLFGMFNNQAFYILFIFGAAIIGLVKNYKNIFVLILLFFTLSLSVFYLALNIPGYHWYYSIHFLTLFVLCGFGISEIIRFVNAKLKTRALQITAICLIFIYPVLTQLEIARLLQNEKPHSQYKLAGEWLKENTPENSVVAAVEIGHIGWYSKRNIVDILGLTNPHNAEFISSGHFSKWYEVYKPDFIVAHNPPWPQEEIIPVLISKGEFTEVSVKGLKDYKILKSNNKH
ncbi:MAG: hypothetical protein IAE90_06330 [Ignavibacteria bacterium]|nr:hypothetical protein [Ignavibacteria bacterium]